METTQQQIKKMLALKAVCALSNTLGTRSFEKNDSQAIVKDLELTKQLLQDLSSRLLEVENEPTIKEVKKQLDAFITELNKNTTYGEVVLAVETAHKIIDPIYWSHSEKLGIPHP